MQVVEIDKSLRACGIGLKQDWLTAICRKLNSNRLNVEDLLQQIFESLLNEDLNIIGSSSLPADLEHMHNTRLEGPFIVQVNEIANVAEKMDQRHQDGAGRLLKLHITDGSQRVIAIEHRRVADLSAVMPLGIKVAPTVINDIITHNATQLCLSDVLVRHGVLMVDPHSVQVVGGQVEALNRSPVAVDNDVNEHMSTTKAGASETTRPVNSGQSDVPRRSKGVTASIEDKQDKAIPPDVHTVRAPDRSRGTSPVVRPTPEYPLASIYSSLQQPRNILLSTANPYVHHRATVNPFSTPSVDKGLDRQTTEAHPATNTSVISLQCLPTNTSSSAPTISAAVEMAAGKFPDSPVLSSDSSGSTGFWNRVGTGTVGVEGNPFLLDDETSFDYGEPVSGLSKNPQISNASPRATTSTRIPETTADLSVSPSAYRSAQHIHSSGHESVVTHEPAFTELTPPDLLASFRVKALNAKQQAASSHIVHHDECTQMSHSDDDGLPSPPRHLSNLQVRKASDVVVIDIIDSPANIEPSQSHLIVQGHVETDWSMEMEMGREEKEEGEDDDMFSQVPAPPQWTKPITSMSKTTASSVSGSSYGVSQSLTNISHEGSVGSKGVASGNTETVYSASRTSEFNHVSEQKSATGRAIRCYVADVTRAAEERARCGQDHEDVETSPDGSGIHIVSCVVVNIRQLKIRKDEYYVLVEVDDGKPGSADSNSECIFPLVRIGPRLCEQVLHMSAKVFELEKQQNKTLFLENQSRKLGEYHGHFKFEVIKATSTDSKHMHPGNASPFLVMLTDEYDGPI